MSLEQLTLSDEQVEDVVASLITGGGGSDVVYDDANDTLTVSLSDSISVNTLEADAITDGANVSHTGELADVSDLSNPAIQPISKATLNNDVSFSFSLTGFSSYLFEFSALTANDFVAGVTAQISDDGGSTYFSSDYTFTVHKFGADVSRESDTAAQEWNVTGQAFTDQVITGRILLKNPNDSTNPTEMTGQFGRPTQSNNVISSAIKDTGTSIDNIRFRADGGAAEFRDGAIKLFGVVSP